MQINRNQVWVRAYLWTLGIHLFMGIILLPASALASNRQLPVLGKAVQGQSASGIEAHSRPGSTTSLTFSVRWPPARSFFTVWWLGITGASHEVSTHRSRTAWRLAGSALGRMVRKHWSSWRSLNRSTTKGRTPYCNASFPPSAGDLRRRNCDLGDAVEPSIHLGRAPFLTGYTDCSLERRPTWGWAVL